MVRTWLYVPAIPLLNNEVSSSHTLSGTGRFKCHLGVRRGSRSTDRPKSRRTLVAALHSPTLVASPGPTLARPSGTHSRRGQRLGASLDAALGDRWVGPAVGLVMPEGARETVLCGMRGSTDWHSGSLAGRCSLSGLQRGKGVGRRTGAGTGGRDGSLLRKLTRQIVVTRSDSERTGPGAASAAGRKSGRGRPRRPGYQHQVTRRLGFPAAAAAARGPGWAGGILTATM